MLSSRLTLILGICLLAACATRYPVALDYDQQYAFTGKTTYALIQPEGIETVRNDLVRNRIETALQQQLAAQGLTPAEKDQAELWISYFATSERTQDIHAYNRYNSFFGYAHCYQCLYPMPLASTELTVVDYTEATLIIDIIDPASNTLKWRGSTTSKVTTSYADSLTVAERTERVNQAVAAILSRFPPQGSEAP